MSNWRRVTADPWILQVVQGHHLELIRTPVQGSQAREINMSDKIRVQVGSEVLKLEQKGAILESESIPGQFVSSIFAVPKKDGSQRPVVNLKPLNEFIAKEHFKMEGVQMVRDLLRKDDFMVVIDLKDAYLSVPVVENHRRFLRFRWEGKLYEFQCLTFGLSSALRSY